MKTDKLIETLAGEGSSVLRPLSPARQVGKWLLFTFFFFAVLVGAVGVRPDLNGKLSDTGYLIELTLALLTTLSASAAAGWLSLPDIKQQAWVRWAPFVPLSLFVAYLGYGMEPAMPDMAKALSEEYQSAHYDCAWHILLFSLAPGIALFFMMRKAAPVHYFWAGGMAVLAMTGSGYIVLRLLEANDSFFHLFLWHFMPMACFSLLGVGLGKFALRW